ncbi:MAG: F0F1 ATP synthase subunit B [Rhodothermales bacterium]
MIYLSALLTLALETPTPSLLQPSAGIVVWTAVVFLIVLGLLWKFAWGPITSALEQRETTIDASIRRAEEALAEARKIQADNERARREAEQEAQRILRDARENADRLRQEELDRTRGHVQALQEQARADIEREKQGALEELRSEVADLAILAAERILRESVDGTRQRKLVDDFLDRLPEN